MRIFHEVDEDFARLGDERMGALCDLDLAEMQAADARITGDVFSVLSVEASVASRTSQGGTAPARVREQVTEWRERLKETP